MNKDVKTLWTTRLRSGQDEQGRSALHRGDKFCCLGVLCEIAVEQGLHITVKDRDNQFHEPVTVAYNNATVTLPEIVMEWAGIDSVGTLPHEVFFKDNKQSNLADLNDEGMTFEEIADVIEKQF